MTTTRTPQTIIRRLKKEVQVLHQKEVAAKNQLMNVFSELKNLGGAYEKQAAKNISKMKAKMKAGQGGPFIKAMEEVEKQLVQKVASQKERFASIMAIVEKNLSTQIAKAAKLKSKVGSKVKASSKTKRKTRS